MLADILHKVAQLDREDEHAYWPRPSMAGPEKCIRAMVYHRLGYPRKVLSGRAITIFSDSSWHEDLTIDWIRKTSFAIHSEQMEVMGFSVNGKLRKGSIDGIITDILGVDRLLEHKALNHFTFEKFKTGGALVLPLDYITQSCIYVKGLKETNPDIDEAILLIKNKNTSAYLEYLLHYDAETDTCTVKTMTASDGTVNEINEVIPNIIGDAVKKFEDVEDYAQKKTLPLRQYEMEDWQCEYCSWGEKCWEGYEKEIEAFTDDAVLEGEIVELSQHYLEIDGHWKAMEKDCKAKKAVIKGIIKAAGARQGRAGDYIFKLSTQKKSSLDKSLIPDALLKKATKTGISERLTIRKVKPQEYSKPKKQVKKKEG